MNVSNDLPFVRKFQDVIRAWKDIDEIENHIRESLVESNSVKARRIRIAIDNSWNRRAEEAIEHCKMLSI